MALVPRENDHDGWPGGLALLPLQSFKTEHLHKVQLDRFTDLKKLPSFQTILASMLQYVMNEFPR